jgi:hypothetical protein
VKSTYSAVVRVPEQLTALMSAVPDEGFVSSNEAAGKKPFKFNQVLRLLTIQPLCKAYV